MMKYKSSFERTVKRSCIIFTVMALLMSVLTGCVIGTEGDYGSISRSGVSSDMTSKAASDGENESGNTDDSIPEEWRNHLYLEPKNKGFCKKLDGKILVELVFVSDTESDWDEETRKSAEEELLAELQKLEAEALEFGAEPDIYYISTSANVDIKAESDNSDEWKLAAMTSLGYSSVYSAQLALESTDGYECAPIVFVLNKNGRAFASQQTASETGAETLVIYSSDISALRHELLHLFGAKDFYYPEEVQTAAEKYLKNSIMSNSAEGTVDELTAFLVGWTDKLGANAISFLEATKHLTKDYLSEESDKNQLTGYGTRSYGDGTYTGNMVFGVPQGEGTYTWNNGDCYIGSWKDGERTGKGKLVWADGDVYEGDFADGERTGRGKLVFANGDVYEGEFNENERTGEGIYTWANGDSYEGSFINGVRTGKGKYIWTNGDSYEGDFVEGERTGKGKYTWTNGDVYEGDFVNGVRTGKGKYTWTNGDVYEGEFEENKFDGYGIWTGADGGFCEGVWENGEFVG